MEHMKNVKFKVGKWYICERGGQCCPRDMRDEHFYHEVVTYNVPILILKIFREDTVNDVYSSGSFKVLIGDQIYKLYMWGEHHEEM
jgi:hypothetical protein